MGTDCWTGGVSLSLILKQIQVRSSIYFLPTKIMGRLPAHFKDL